MLSKSIHKKIYRELVNLLDATPMKRADIIARFYEIAATSEEKDKEKALLAKIKSDGRKRFDYCADLSPDRFMWLIADECGERVALKLSYDETLYGILSPNKETNE